LRGIEYFFCLLIKTGDYNLPKFKFNQSLVEVLKALGMTDAFSYAKANLTGISDADQLAVSEVMHKSYIKVDERGTEAAAITEVTIIFTSVGQDNSFRGDHPFVFDIRERDTKAILFIGKVMNLKPELTKRNRNKKYVGIIYWNLLKNSNNRNYKTITGCMP